mgnify:CR=1 FL=1
MSQLLQNAPFGIIYLSDYAWNNVVNMEPRAQLRLERLTAYATPFVADGVQPCTNLQFTMDELNTLSSYETNLNDYIRTNLINWVNHRIAGLLGNSEGSIGFRRQTALVRDGVGQLVAARLVRCPPPARAAQKSC